MCIAIVKPASQSISKDRLETCFENNPDGAGFAIRSKSGVIIHKGFMTFDAFYAAYENQNVNSRDALIHFRITTRGADSKENCHPFALANGALIHNGTIHELGEARGKGKSDTRELAELLYMVPTAALHHMKPLLEKFFDYNKVAVMDTAGEFVIFNEASWVKDDGVLYSNDGFREDSWYNGTGYYSRSSLFSSNKTTSTTTVTTAKTDPTDDPAAPGTERFDLRAFAHRLGEEDTWNTYGFVWDESTSLWFNHEGEAVRSRRIEDMVLDIWLEEICSELPDVDDPVDMSILNYLVVEAIGEEDTVDVEVDEEVDVGDGNLVTTTTTATINLATAA